MAAIVTVTPNPALDRTLTVPAIQFDQMVRATASLLEWGGKGVNVSRALRGLGTESVVMGFAGGASGRLWERGLGGWGIATDLVYVEGEMRTNTVITDGERYVKVNEAGPPVEAGDVALFFERVRGRVRPGDIWILSGSLPPGVPVDFYARLIVLLREAEAKALLDASGEPLSLGCAAGPYLAKPNAEEAGEAMGSEVVSEAGACEAIRFFLRQGVEVVALSLGAEGLLLGKADRVVWARPPRVATRNPVGAGDALLAGIAWALEREAPLDEMARWGVAAGTAAAMCEGMSFTVRDEVDGMYHRVQVTGCKTPLGEL